tara:strand:- start:41 stop:457 length:417 start_codon:yes stop_codon:yes gene_type:complete
MNNVKDLKFLDLDIKSDNRGDLIAIEFEKHFNVPIKRSFLVFGEINTIRGNHAHIECNQFLCCLSGSCEIRCDDGINSYSQVLNNPSKIIKIPNMIWSSQRYISEHTILLVFCDLDYCEKDYIRNYKNYLTFRKEICK